MFVCRVESVGSAQMENRGELGLPSSGLRSDAFSSAASCCLCLREVRTQLCPWAALTLFVSIFIARGRVRSGTCLSSSVLYS